MKIVSIPYEQVVNPDLSIGAILNEEYTGFREDYLVLHCLLAKNKEKINRFLEVGTNMGTGTKIICNALGAGRQVFSLDLPLEKAHKSLQHPKGGMIGVKCDLPYTQLFGDSMEFDYASIKPINATFIDAEHVYPNVLHETTEVLKHYQPDLMIWHDTDISEVLMGLMNAFDATGQEQNYNLYRVANTRMSYAEKTAL